MGSKRSFATFLIQEKWRTIKKDLLGTAQCADSTPLQKAPARRRKAEIPVGADSNSQILLYESPFFVYNKKQRTPLKEALSKMPNYTLQLRAEENLVLSGAVAARLIASGDGDAALLYLALLRRQGDASPEALAVDLRWPSDRFQRAEGALLSLGLLGGHRPAAADLEPPARERPDYTRDDVTSLLERDNRFSGLTAEVERKLGKRLSTADLQILVGLYDYLGLPAEVIFLLVNHCAERISTLYGSGRRPTLRQIEKEGYRWAKLELMDLDRASAYLKQYAARQGQIPRLMSMLGLGDRRPSPSEEKYLLSWLEMGFSPEAIELAYDKTILKCRELKWSYLNGILRHWHEKGLHSLQEVQEGDAAPARRDGEDLSWMKQYL